MILTTDVNRRTPQNDINFKTFFQPYKKRLYRTALILTKNPQRAEELVQEVYLKAKQGYRQLSAITNFGCWLSELLVKTYIEKFGKFKSN